MHDIISKILKMDEEARKITEEVKSTIEKSEEEVRDYRKKIRTEYLDRARKRIEKNRISEQEYSDSLLKETKSKHEEILSSMDDKFKLNFDSWVKQIIERTIRE